MDKGHTFIQMDPIIKDNSEIIFHKEMGSTLKTPQQCFMSSKENLKMAENIKASLNGTISLRKFMNKIVKILRKYNISISTKELLMSMKNLMVLEL